MKVVVVGGGFAGETAALALQERHQVTLLERRGVLGGRATSYHDAVSNQQLDNAPQVLQPSDANTLELLRRAGAADLLAVWDCAGVPVLLARCGWALIHQRVASRFEALGGRVRRRALAEAIAIEAGRAIAVQGVQRAEAADERRRGKPAEPLALVADVVIAAVPWFALAGLLPQPWRSRPPFAGLASVVGETAVSVHVWLDQPVIGPTFASWNDPHVMALFDQGRLHQRPGPPQHLVLRMAAGALGCSNTEVAALAVSALCRRWPTLRESAILRTLVLREPGALFPETAPSSARLPTITPIEGLFLAGDWTATGLPASIESATLSGLLAARAVDPAA